MFFPQRDRSVRASAYALSSTVGVAGLARLWQISHPQLVLDIPQFRPRTRPRPVPTWLERVRAFIERPATLIAAFVIVVAAVAAALPAWSFLNGDASAVAARSSTISSAGVTGSAATRVENLGVANFVGGVPFVQQTRYLSAIADTAPAPARFVAGAQQAPLATYLNDVGAQVTLRYVSDAAATKEQVDAWMAALAQAEAEAQAQQQAAAAPAAVAWQAPPVGGGTARHATVTFYSCINNGFCGLMANGQQVFAGAAACSYDLPFGTRFIVNEDPSGRVFVCLDRGALSNTWVDIWFYDAADGWAWQSNVGTSGTITILE